MDVPLSAAPIRLLFCCNPPFYQHLAVALISLLENNRHHRFVIHVFSSGSDKCGDAMLQATIAMHRNSKLDITYVSVERFAHFFINHHISHETYLRIVVAEVLDPTIEKIIYLDADLVITGDIGALWETEIKGYALAGVPDPWCGDRKALLRIPTGRPYVNAGVMVMNLTFWRDGEVGRRLIQFIEAHNQSLTFWDQDAINALMHQWILPLPYRWNCQARMFKMDPRQVIPDRQQIRREARHAVIIHYAGRQKPWHFLSTVAKKRLYQQYLQKTPWRGASAEGRTLRNFPRYCLKRATSALGDLYRRVWPTIAPP